jgi:hypothetical protein
MTYSKLLILLSPSWSKKLTFHLWECGRENLVLLRRQCGAARHKAFYPWFHFTHT